MKHIIPFFWAILLFTGIMHSGRAAAVDLSKAPASDLLALYEELRSVGLDSNKTAFVEGITFKKDVATFDLSNGYLYFLAPVAERVVGAVFIGKGTLTMKPPSDLERNHLAMVSNGSTEVSEPFKVAVMIFTDDTLAELSKLVKFQPGNVPSKAANAWQGFRKKMREELKNNIEAQILAELCFPKFGSFAADIEGERHGNFLFSVEPQRDEEVQLINYNIHDFVDTWSSFHQEEADRAGAPRASLEKDLVDTAQINLDIVIEKGEKLSVKAQLEFTARVDAPRLLNLRLAPTLRVSEVNDGSGAGLKFIQEDKKKDADFWVILPEPLVKGKKYVWHVTYAGDEVIRNAGSGNYYVGARTSWYPKVAGSSLVFKDRAMYTMKFQAPKEFTLVATGQCVKRYKEDKYEFSEWKTELPYTVVGFNYGKYAAKSQKDEKLEVTVYSNPGLNDELRQLQLMFDSNPELARAAGITTGGFNTTNMAKNAAIEAFNSMRLFSHFFGEIPFKTVSITQQPAGNFGQSWPTLVFMPYTAFLDSTMRHQLQLSSSARGRQFFEEVGSHEVAHQWWGHIIGWKTYHDQWLSEGFAQFSAGLYIQQVEGEKKFKRFLELERQHIMEKLENGKRATETGPIWMGHRLQSKKTRGAYQRLVYAKGGYILHMLRMMLFDFAKNNDTRFINMMRDFVKTYYNKDASTEDFKTVVDKHFNQDMGWFFKQWVYGTEIPKVSVYYELADGENGKTLLKGTVTQQNVSDDFKLMVPVVLRFKKGISSGKLLAQGKSTPFSIALPDRPDSVEINPLLSVLGEVEVRK